MTSRVIPTTTKRQYQNSVTKNRLGINLKIETDRAQPNLVMTNSRLPECFGNSREDLR